MAAELVHLSRTFAFIVILISFFHRICETAPSCDSVNNANKEKCRYGNIQYCGKTVCAKGNGERCDRHPLSSERCGLGYFCLCGQCQGCSLLTLQDCFYHTTNCKGR